MIVNILINKKKKKKKDLDVETRPKQGPDRCRLYRRKEEYLRHVTKECETTGGPKDTGKTLNETREGLTELKAIIEKRRAIQDGEERQEGRTARMQKPKVAIVFSHQLLVFSF